MKGCTRVAQNKKKTTSPAPQALPAKQEPSTAGAAKARRKLAQEAREKANKERRAQGLPTDHELAVKERRERRAAERLALESASRKTSKSTGSDKPSETETSSKETSSEANKSEKSTSAKPASAPSSKKPKSVPSSAAANAATDESA